MLIAIHSFLYLFYNWRIIALQSFVVFYQTATWISHQFSSVQLLSCVRLFVTPWTTACQSSMSITNYRSLPKPMSIELVTPSKHLILCHPVLLLPSIFPSIRVFSNESVLCIRCMGSVATEWLHFHFSFLCIGEGNGNPLQCSCPENPRDGGAWWAAVYGVAQS